MSMIDASSAPCTPFKGSDTHSTTHVLPSAAAERGKEKRKNTYEQIDVLFMGLGWGWGWGGGTLAEMKLFQES